MNEKIAKEEREKKEEVGNAVRLLLDVLTRNKIKMSIAGDVLLNLFLKISACMNVPEEELKIILDQAKTHYPKVLESKREFEDYK